MSSPQTRSLRLRAGVVIVALQWLLFWVTPLVAGDVEIFGFPLAVLAMFAGIAGGLATLIWWLFFSRAPWVERIGAIVIIVAGVAITKQLVHESIEGAHMGVSIYMLPIPGLCLALVVWAAATQRLQQTTRAAALVGVIALALLPWTLIRTAGLFGSGSEYHWRWTPTPEERLLAQASAAAETPSQAAATAASTAAPTATDARAKSDARTTRENVAGGSGTGEGKAATSHVAPANERAGGAAPNVVASEDRSAKVPRAAEWPGFRGPNRDSVVRQVEINTDWSSSPPIELWRRAIGPGWSSFAVDGDLIYTQEQRGEQEVVSCYRLSTGQPVWRHADATRFWESNGGAGPRGTPTVDNGRVYALGATGILNALDAATGARLWSRNISTDLNRRVPDWGFSSSPLIIDDVVIIAAAGTLAGYDAANGNLRWQGPRYGASYSSPHRVTLDGVEQVVLLGGPGAISVAPDTGAVLWEHKWHPGSIVQPAMTPDGDILVNAMTATGGVGTRRLHATRSGNGWTLEERWTSNGLKPYFNDFVVHEAHAYGFDGSILAAIALDDGVRKWKGGRFGNGQLMLLADQDLLLVISEDGELALVRAMPDTFTEVARFQALNAKTWNHPVLVRDVLLLRNGEEMAAFKLQPVHSTNR